MSLSGLREQREKLFEIHLRALGTVLRQASIFGQESAPVHLLHRLEDELESVLALSRALEIPVPPLIDDACRFLGRPLPVVQSAGEISSRQESNESGFDAFLSYSSFDQAAVRKLADRLQAQGLRIWLDEEQIGPGDSITGKIEEGLRCSRYVLLCLTEKAKESYWCRAEYRALLHQEIHQRETRVIPVIIGDYNRETASPLICDKLHIDVRSQIEFDLLVKRLRSVA
jgi:hypothetical protein